MREHMSEILVEDCWVRDVIGLCMSGSLKS